MAPALLQPRDGDGVPVVSIPRGPSANEPWPPADVTSPSPLATRADADPPTLVQRQSPLDSPSPTSLTGGFINTLGTITPVPATYGNLDDSPVPGAVAGIVLGSVVGFLLLLALLYTCCAFGPMADTASSWGAPSAITLRTRRGRNRSPSRHRTRSRHRSQRRVSRVSETVEVRTSARRASASHHHHPAIILDGRVPDHDSDTEEIVVMRDGRRRSVSRPAGGPPPPRAVHDSESEDEIIVVEEHDRPRRRSTSRRASGVYRDRESRRYSRGG